MTFSPNVKLVLLLYCLALSESTIDINLSEYQYLSDHLTSEECYKLVAALHFKEYNLPDALISAERRLPKDVPCIDLLVHWNSTPKEGKGKTHVEVGHRLNQIGRSDLAQWLSETVFHQLSNDVNSILNSSQEELAETTTHVTVRVDACTSDEEQFVDEAAWLEIDTIMSILVVLGLATFISGWFYWCYLYCSSKSFARSAKGYKTVSTCED